jgi:DNA invertase Pin-like site-specific DNA recombinase
VKIGYARCSTVEQDTEQQVSKLVNTFGVSPGRVYVDHGFTGKTMTRDGYEKARAALRAGDELVVPAMDRLARNATETLALMQELTNEGVTLNIGGVVYNPADPMSKLFMTLLAAVAEAEGGWISIRTKEAMARPSVRAKLRGKQPSFSPKQDAIIARHLEEGELSVMEIAAMFSTSRASVYRAAARHRARVS